MTISRALADPNFNSKTQIGPYGVLNASEVTRVVGTTFPGTAIDTNVWGSTLANGGTTANGGGEITLATNTTANGSAILTSNRTARYASGASNFFFAPVQLGDTGTTNNVRRWGAFNDTNGCFFQLSGTTLTLVTRKASVDAGISAFNGTPFTLDTNAHYYEIHYTPLAIYWMVDGVLLHTQSYLSAPWTETMHLQARLQNTNSGGATANVSLKARMMNISRFGRGNARPQFANITSSGTYTIKLGPGSLSRVIINTAGTTSTFTVYDNTVASGTVIAIIDSSSGVGALDYNLDFNNGLTIVASATPGDLTFVYE